MSTPTSDADDAAGPAEPTGSTTDPDAAVEVLESTREQLHAQARQALGVTGFGDAPPLRETLREHGVGLYPLLALSALVIVDEFQRAAFFILLPEISESLGISRALVGVLVQLSFLSMFLAALPIAAFVQRRARRAFTAITTGVLWSATTVWSGFIRAPVVFVGMLMLDGATTGSVGAVHQPLLFDSYPPTARIRALSYYRGADALGRVLAPAIVALVTSRFVGMTWRGAFLVMGVVSLLATLIAARLRDPGFGGFDTRRIREQVHEEHHDEAKVTEEDVGLGFFEIIRRLFAITTVRRLYLVMTFLGAFFVPFAAFLAFFLEERFLLTPGARGVFSATTPILGILAVAAVAKYGEGLFRRGPSELVKFVATMIGVGLLALMLGVVSPWLIGVWFGFGVMQAAFFAAIPLLAAIAMAIIPPRMRPHFSAMQGIFLFGAGGLLGNVLLGSLERRFGLAVALFGLAIPAALATVTMWRTHRYVDADLDRMIDEILEDEEVKTLRSQGVTMPLLTCRDVDFGYDQLKVLFNVSFTVQEGEMVALLGTNGAGKSTLLRVISGLGYPWSGSVRLQGQDVTFLDPTRRVDLGISQIPGGKAVFPDLSVTDNLRAYGFSLGRDRRRIDEGIETTFDAFPRLAERRDQLAGTLSGGEAQMLALGKALLLRPRLLLIDELSLGLAPKIVAELLGMVRTINDRGTAIVLVEQSVNIALSLVDHAYFMEKGEIRFDGSAEDLLARDDLLRSVFLEGATKGTEG